MKKQPQPGDTIVVWFSCGAASANGAGTTGLVALNHGRKYIGCELNKDYIDLTLTRLEPVLAQLTLF